MASGNLTEDLRNLDLVKLNNFINHNDHLNVTFKRKMENIINAIPTMEQGIKSSLLKNLRFLGTDFVSFLRSQTNNMHDDEEESNWSEIILPLTEKIYSDLESNAINFYYKEIIGKQDFGRNQSRRRLRN